MNTSEVLNKAADDLERNGWRQLSPGMMVGGPHCALGAIGSAADVTAQWQMYSFESVAAHPAAVALADHLGVHLGKEGEGVYMWNDAKDRTASEVIEALRAAAVIEAAKENDSRADVAAVGVAATGEAVR